MLSRDPAKVLSRPDSLKDIKTNKFKPKSKKIGVFGFALGFEALTTSN